MITITNMTVALPRTVRPFGHTIFRNSPKHWRRNSAMVGRGATQTGGRDGDPPGRSIQPVVGGAGGLGGDGGVRAPAGSGSTTLIVASTRRARPRSDALGPSTTTVTNGVASVDNHGRNNGESIDYGTTGVAALARRPAPVATGHDREGDRTQPAMSVHRWGAVARRAGPVWSRQC